MASLSKQLITATDYQNKPVPNPYTEGFVKKRKYNINLNGSELIQNGLSSRYSQLGAQLYRIRKNDSSPILCDNSWGIHNQVYLNGDQIIIPQVNFKKSSFRNEHVWFFYVVFVDNNPLFETYEFKVLSRKRDHKKLGGAGIRKRNKTTQNRTIQAQLQQRLPQKAIESEPFQQLYQLTEQQQQHKPEQPEQLPLQKNQNQNQQFYPTNDYEITLTDSSTILPQHIDSYNTQPEDYCWTDNFCSDPYPPAVDTTFDDIHNFLDSLLLAIPQEQEKSDSSSFNHSHVQSSSFEQEQNAEMEFNNYQEDSIDDLKRFNESLRENYPIYNILP
eukprot:gb/GECH01008558.1/.p1 GENE.gb/GECH01008558.1/~~gb/GECH01008558.1/.p1  ORF type:complete len:330 (+),score=84.23 gb/GECH01008558.1/:1-990(+)